ncbi:MAG: RNA polymerase sigma-54 factor [Bacteroidia bacterium]|nr:MAG: RNA polymerase sigma-54 factor [Bacteroidia bacterium]
MGKARLSLQQKLSLNLGPLQLQVIGMLALPIHELERRVTEEIERNPTLEEEDSPPEGGETPDDAPGPADEFAPEDYLPDDLRYDELPRQGAAEPGTEERTIAAQTTFREHLVEQLKHLRVAPDLRPAAEYIIWNLDDDGYLRTDLEDLRDQMYLLESHDIDPARWREALRLIQSMPPAGIGAKDLRECLLLQLRGDTSLEATLARRVLQEAFEALTRRNFEQMLRTLGCTEPQLQQAIERIATLSPRPEIPATESGYAQTITPDFHLTIDGNGERTITLNGRNSPDLRVSHRYAQMLSDLQAQQQQRELSTQEQETASFVRQHIESARGFIEAIRLRNGTLTRIMEAILAAQADYFQEGDPDRLRPLMMKDIASATGLDLSTVSRVANGKYIQTPWGILPLRQLFARELAPASPSAAETTETQTTLEAKNHLQQLIDQEDKHEPLTDEQLADRMHRAGYPISRRTVAKYRHQLGLATARLRREL